MSTQLFIFGELLGTVRGKGGALLAAVVLLILSFLALFSSFFLLGTPTKEESGSLLPPGEVIVHLSPRLSPEAVEKLYLKIREREEVRRINYLFAQELEESRAGGILVIRTVEPQAFATLVEALGSVNGIMRIDSPVSSKKDVLLLSTPLRIALLAGLVVSVVASLIVARHGFRELLHSFAGEIRLMRLSGTAERAIQPPIIALGVLCGILASLVLILALYLLHSFAVSHPQAVLRVASGLVEPERVLTVSLLSLLLGLVIGGLVGVLGASLTGSREFQP